MIYDCFSYWDEDLLLDLRLNILDNYIDYFVIVEGNKTWQNNPKKLRFEIDKFKKFKDKIIYVPVTDLPDGVDPYLRENHQRNSIIKGLKNSKENDLIIISDLDEIPNPEKLISFNVKKRFAVFKQKHFYYKFNLKFKKRPFWRIDKLRLNNIIESGGWHFCNLKTPEKLLYKYKNLCETNDPVSFKEKIDEKFLNLDEIKQRIVKKKDIIGREDNFNKIEIDKSFPIYLQNNINLYKDWIDE